MLVQLIAALLCWMSPNDPNFIEWFINADPNIRSEYMSWLREQEEPTPEQRAKWRDVNSLILQSFCEDWLISRDVIYNKIFPYEPNYFDFYIPNIIHKLRGDGWEYDLNASRQTKYSYKIHIKVSRPRVPNTMEDFAELSRSWLLKEDHPDVED